MRPKGGTKICLKQKFQNFVFKGSMAFQGLFAVRDPYLGFFNDSMMFSLNFRSFKKTRNPPTDRPTDGRTDRRMDTPSYRDAWTHLKRSKAFLA